MFYTFRIIITIIRFIGLFTFIIQRHHLLIALLSLEGVILSIVLFLILNFSSVDSFICIIILTFGACEARLGLACLVLLIRRIGSDQLSILTIVKW